MADITPSTSSTKPYLVRAIYEWCSDNGFTPYVAVFVNAAVRVPMEYVKNREIVLNISFEATQGLKIDNEAITFRARFAGVARDIWIPVDNIVAVYARENGQGMAFPLTPELQREQSQGNASADAENALHDDDAAPAPEHKAKLAPVQEAGHTQNLKPAAGKRKAGSSSSKAVIHAVGPEDMADTDNGITQATDTPDPKDPSSPKGPKGGGKGTGGGSRPSLKRVK